MGIIRYFGWLLAVYSGVAAASGVVVIAAAFLTYQPTPPLPPDNPATMSTPPSGREPEKSPEPVPVKPTGKEAAVVAIVEPQATKTEDLAVAHELKASSLRLVGEEDLALLRRENEQLKSAIADLEKRVAELQINYSLNLLNSHPPHTWYGGVRTAEGGPFKLDVPTINLNPTQVYNVGEGAPPEIKMGPAPSSPPGSYASRAARSLPTGGFLPRASYLGGYPYRRSGYGACYGGVAGYGAYYGGGGYAYSGDGSGAAGKDYGDYGEGSYRGAGEGT